MGKREVWYAQDRKVRALLLIEPNSSVTGPVSAYMSLLLAN